MTHLPECRLAHKCHGLTGADGEHAMKMDYCVACHRPCICEELRACEERVRDEEIVKCARKVAAMRRRTLDQVESAVYWSAPSWSDEQVIPTVKVFSIISDFREEQ